MLATLLLFRESRSRGGGSSIVTVPRDVPPARVKFFKLSSLAKNIRFANFSPFSLGKGMLLGNFCRFWSGQGMLFGNFGQRNVKFQEMAISVIPVKKPKCFQIFGPENAKIWQVLSRKCH